MNFDIESIKESLMGLLNSHPISTDSIEGWLLIFLIAFVVWNLYRKALKFVVWSCSAILLVQVCYFLGQTDFNNILPLSSIFKYDVLTAMAQTCVGTPLCDGMLHINATIQYIIVNSWHTIRGFIM